MLLVCAALTVCGSTPDATALRTWKSVSGKSVEAEYIDLKYGKVKLRTSDGNLITISAQSLSAEDRAWIKEEETKRNAPAEVLPPKHPYELPVFKDGEWKGYYAVYTARNFDACMDSRGVIWVYPKEKGTRVGKPMRLYEDCYHRDDNKEYRPVSVTAFQNSPAPAMQPKTLTLAGVLTRDVPFSVTYEFSEAGIKAYGDCQDPRQIEQPTVFRLRVRIPASHTFEELGSVAEQKETLKDWQVMATPVKGKRRTIAYWESVPFVWGRNRQVTIDAPVYGERKICFKSGNPKAAFVSPTLYSGKSPWQGYSVVCTKDERDISSRRLDFEIEIE